MLLPLRRVCCLYQRSDRRIADIHDSFHIVNNHSAEVHRQGNQLDYLGIVILMWGSTIPSVYYGFYCDPELQRLYWLVVSNPSPSLAKRMGPKAKIQQRLQ